MAKSIAIPEQLYSVGPHQATVDSFPAGVSSCTVTMTVVGWPGAAGETIANFSVVWSDGTGINFGIPGQPTNRDGSPMTLWQCVVGVPEISDGQGGKKRKNVLSAVATLNVIQPLRTAITVTAA